MPTNPSPSIAISRPDVRGVVYRQWDARGQTARFIGDQLFPELRLDAASATIKRIPREEWLKKAIDTLRAEGGYKRGNFRFNDFAISTEEHGLEQPVSAKSSAAARIYFDSMAVAAEIVLYQGWLAAERARVALAQSTSLLPNDSAAHRWSDHATATPLDDAKAARQAIEDACGQRPNVVVIPARAFDELILCDQFLDRIGSVSDDPKQVTRAAVAALFEVDRVLVPGGLDNSANDGQTAVLTSLWDKTKVTFACVDPNPSAQGFTAFWGAHWDGDGSEFAWRVEQYWNESDRTDVVRARRQVKPQIVEAAGAYVLHTVL